MEMKTDFLKWKVAIKHARTPQILRGYLKRRKNLLISRLTLAAGRFTLGGNCFMILPRLSYMVSSDRKLTEGRLMRFDKSEFSKQTK